jgi:hypothetical protein
MRTLKLQKKRWLRVPYQWLNIQAKLWQKAEKNMIELREEHQKDGNSPKMAHLKLGMLLLKKQDKPGMLLKKNQLNRGPLSKKNWMKRE